MAGSRTLIAAAAALAVLAMPASGQRSVDADRPTIALTGWGGVSIREGQSSFRFAEDLRTYGIRVALTRFGVHPWVQADRFVRPDLVCPGVGDCATEGFLFRAGATLPLVVDPDEPGLQPRLVSGIGLSLADDRTRFSYLLGIGATWVLHPRLAPAFEVRWERVPGLRNVVMLNAGMRFGLF